MRGGPRPGQKRWMGMTKEQVLERAKKYRAEADYVGRNGGHGDLRHYEDCRDNACWLENGASRMADS